MSRNWGIPFVHNKNKYQVNGGNARHHWARIILNIMIMLENSALTFVAKI